MQCRVADAVALTPLYLRRTRVRRRTAPARRPARARARYAREHTPSRRTFVVPAAELYKDRIAESTLGCEKLQFFRQFNTLIYRYNQSQTYHRQHAHVPVTGAGSHVTERHRGSMLLALSPCTISMVCELLLHDPYIWFHPRLGDAQCRRSEVRTPVSTLFVEAETDPIASSSPYDRTICKDASERPSIARHPRARKSRGIQRRIDRRM